MNVSALKQTSTCGHRSLCALSPIWSPSNHKAYNTEGNRGDGRVLCYKWNSRINTANHRSRSALREDGYTKLNYARIFCYLPICYRVIRFEEHDDMFQSHVSRSYNALNIRERLVRWAVHMNRHDLTIVLSFYVHIRIEQTKCCPVSSDRLQLKARWTSHLCVHLVVVAAGNCGALHQSVYTDHLSLGCRLRLSEVFLACCFPRFIRKGRFMT
jgi:hypothetical protein